MPGSRKLSREDRRRAIIDAAVEVFAKKGFFGARVSEIAEQAQVADGTIYLYFKSKDDLLISLFEEKMQEIIQGLESILADVRTPEEKIEKYVIAHLTLVATQPTLMQVLTIELRQSARFIKEYSPKGFGKYLSLIGSILEEGQQTGVFRKELHPGIFRRALFGAIDEISREELLKHPETPFLDPKKIGQQIADFILRGLRA